MKKKHSLAGVVIKAVVAVMLITAAVLVVMFMLSTNGAGFSGTGKKAKNSADRTAMDRAVKYAAESMGMDDSEAEELFEGMDEKDRETLTRIVSKHMSEETFAELAEDLADGDTDELIEFARDNLSFTEQLELLEIAAKYGYITK